MTEATLFDLPEPQEQAPTPPTRPEEAWVLRPDRQQLQWLPRDQEAALAQDHPARAIWGLLQNPDLAAFYSPIRSVVDRPGHPTTDPPVLLALWPSRRRGQNFGESVGSKICNYLIPTRRPNTHKLSGYGAYEVNAPAVRNRGHTGWGVDLKPGNQSRR